MKTSFAAVIVILLTLIACSQPQLSGTQQNSAGAQVAPTPATAPAAPAAAPGTAAVQIKDFAFVPASITVKAGTVVTWTNLDSATHTVKFSESESDPLGQGGSVSMTFSTPGSYEYNCGLHPSMKGVVVVE